MSHPDDYKNREDFRRERDEARLNEWSKGEREEYLTLSAENTRLRRERDEALEASANAMVILKHNKLMRDLLKSIYENWDCDYASRGHHPHCRACAAEAASK